MQPPLYKVSRGKSEVYLKDQSALEDYLIQMGVDGAVLRLGSGEEVGGQDLARVVEDARQVRRVLCRLVALIAKPRIVNEQVARVLALDKDPVRPAPAEHPVFRDQHDRETVAPHDRGEIAGRKLLLHRDDAEPVRLLSVIVLGHLLE